MSWWRQEKDTFWFRRCARAPVTAYIYDWNMLPIGQMLWLKELETYKEFPPLQSPASYNLDQVMEQLKKPKTHRASSSMLAGEAGAPKGARQFR